MHYSASGIDTIMNYYYLIASLPNITIKDAPPLSFDDFMSLCSQHVSPSDLNAINQLLSMPAKKTRNKFINNWQDSEIQLRNSIAKNRATRLGLDAVPYLRTHEGLDSSIDKVVSDAFAKANPSERELAIDKFRWSKAEELGGFDPFTPQALLVYALKLLLAQRWSKMNKENGENNADNVINRDFPAEPGKE